MKAQHLELLVEEPSMVAFLKEVLPLILPVYCTFKVHSFRNKRRMLANLESRLRGDARRLPQEHRIVVLIDRDADNCHSLKQRLESIVMRSGLHSRSNTGTSNWQVATRIVIEELEAWYFGDWDAVRAAYPRVTGGVPPRYRNPDAISGGTWEAFERLMKRYGYFTTGLNKLAAARAIGACFNPDRNTSHSFRIFCQAITEATI